VDRDRGLRAAAVALLVAALAWWKLRAVRASQLVLLGGGKQDLVDFAVSLQGRIDDLHRAVDEIAAGLSRVDRRVDTAVSKTSLVRYDAYEGAGRPPVGLDRPPGRRPERCRLDGDPGRDYARIYVKELDHGGFRGSLSGGGRSGRAGHGWVTQFTQLHFRLDAAGSGFETPVTSR